MMNLFFTKSSSPAQCLLAVFFWFDLCQSFLGLNYINHRWMLMEWWWWRFDPSLPPPIGSAGLGTRKAEGKKRSICCSRSRIDVKTTPAAF